MRSSPRRIGRTLCSESLAFEIDVGGVTHRAVSQAVYVLVMVVPVTVAVPAHCDRASRGTGSDPVLARPRLQSKRPSATWAASINSESLSTTSWESNRHVTRDYSEVTSRYWLARLTQTGAPWSAQTHASRLSPAHRRRWQSRHLSVGVKEEDTVAGPLAARRAPGTRRSEPRRTSLYRRAVIVCDKGYGRTDAVPLELDHGRVGSRNVQ